MMCLVTVRQIKPGSYEDFRKAWQPDPWLPPLQRPARGLRRGLQRPQDGSSMTESCGPEPLSPVELL